MPSPQSVKEMVTGYIEVYDPDYLVEVSPYPTYLSVSEREKITVWDVSPREELDYASSYGTSIVEILHHWKENGRPQAHQDTRIVVPVCGNRHRLFLSSVFGVLPASLHQFIISEFGDFVSEQEVDLQNYWKHLTPQYLFPRRLGLEFGVPSGGPFYVLLMDATNTLDVIDYWNLRAFGASVLPVPTQLFEREEYIQHIHKILHESYKADRTNQGIHHNAKILLGSSLNRNTLDKFIERLGSAIISVNNRPPFSIQSWFPRLWCPKFAATDIAIPSRRRHSSVNDQAIVIDDALEFKPISPEFLSEDGYILGEAHYVNDVSIKSWNRWDIAEVFPPIGQNIGSLVGLGLDWRASDSGLSYIANSLSETAYMRIPYSAELIKSWLGHNGWKVESSAPGKICEKIIEHLGGLHGLNFLAQEGILKLIDDIKPSGIASAELYGRVSKALNGWSLIKPTPRAIFQRLVDAKILRLGCKIQCQICNQYNWYQLSDFNYKVSCDSCLEEFAIPSHSPTDILWHYKKVGPFSLPMRSYGSWSVILTLRFFRQVLRANVSHMFSAEISKEKKKLESDLTLLYKSSLYLDDNQRVTPIFSECKSYNNFDDVDFSRMKDISNEFPESAIVLSTFRDELTPAEVVNMRKLIRHCQRRNQPTIILTKNELFSTGHISLTYKKLGGKFAEYANPHIEHDLHKLSEATQGLYLYT